MRILRSILAAASIAVLAPSVSSASLNILLTNDDGFDAEGIQTMRVALENAGHNVTLVAPLENESGQSAAISLTLVPVLQVGANQYAVGGTPATCVLIGRTAILGSDPDLVVSGTNDGSNTGSGTIFSGTVGAATTGLLAVPSIAFSTDPPDSSEAQVTQHFVDVASFAVDFIAHLETKPGALNKEENLLPERMGLNINYPTLPPGDIQGLQLSAQGRTSDRDLIFQALPGCPPIAELPPGATCYIPGVIPAEPGDDVKDSDVEGLAEGYITIVPIDGDFTSPRSEAGRLNGVLKQFGN